MSTDKKNYHLKKESLILENSGDKAAFSDFNLAEPLMRAIAGSGYSNPTPIQVKSIPIVLTGRDLLAGAQTGTGKTAAFMLPVLHNLLKNKRIKAGNARPRCLVLTPTRELALQVKDSAEIYGKYTLLKSTAVFGGVSIFQQKKSLNKNIDVLVATPGRLLDHMRQKTVDLSGIEIFVLDEADRMLDMGFIRDIRKIIAVLPKTRQNLFFSATLSEEVKALSDAMMDKPALVETARRNAVSELVEHSVHLVPKKLKSELLSHLIRKNQWKQVLVFTRTRNGADRLTEKLISSGIPSASIHSGKGQSSRIGALAKFKKGSIPVLVATDIAARGLNIEQLPYVVNFELPYSSKDYVHRIGRTGRAGCTGNAVSLVGREEYKYLKEIECLIKIEIPRVTVTGFKPSENIPERGSIEKQLRHKRKNKNKTTNTVNTDFYATARRLGEVADRRGTHIPKSRISH